MSLLSFRILPFDDSEGRHVRLPYVPALDGLRALAVLAVILYHLEVGWLPGGFLGVEIFFVISGYLITSLLLAGWLNRGHINFRHFWMGRARRLLPALLLVIAAALAYTVLFLPDEVAALRGDAVASLGYVTNWYLILGHQSYFETLGRPSLLRHLWSLAVEEQFYLVWPLALAAMLSAWRPSRVFLAILLGAVVSIVLMLLLYNPDVDPSRVYYGTDTRAAGLLLGAALAFVCAPGQDRNDSRLSARAWDVAGIGSLAILVGAALWLDEYQPLLYQGGLAIVSLATLVLIASVVRPRSRLGSWLGKEPLRWIGLRSYGLYLWHWPVFMLTRPGLDVTLDGWQLLILRLGLTLVITELVYRYVETPIRRGALGRAWKNWTESQGARRWQIGLRWAGALGIIACLSIALGESVVSAQAPAPPAFLAQASVDTTPIAPPQGDAPVGNAPNFATATRAPTATINLPGATPTAPATASVTASATASVTTSPTAPPLATATLAAARFPFCTTAPSATAAPASGSKPRTFALGDSVMLGAKDGLTKAVNGIIVDAVLGRQVSAGIDLLRANSVAAQAGAVVVIDLGNNGVFSARQFDEMMGLLHEARRVVFVNMKVPRPWQNANNAVLANGVKRYGNAALADWVSASAEHPEFFWSDGIHLRPAGVQMYANLIAGCISAP